MTMTRDCFEPRSGFLLLGSTETFCRAVAAPPAAYGAAERFLTDIDIKILRSVKAVKLTEPGGKLIHINVEHVTSVRSDTQIPGARAQLDLTSGKFQGVQENVEQVMQLISAAPGARENDETPSAAL